MLSKVIRRTHMYLALFLFPWMLMYALSTLAMNHRALFAGKYGSGPVPFEKEREFVYDGSVPADGPFDSPGAERSLRAGELMAISQQILASAGLDGAHNVTRRKDGAIVINRNDLLTPRRITYSPANRTVLVEKMQHRPNAFLERFHRRRGYATGYRLDNIWAASVDLVIIAMVFWVASGLWMWWEMKSTRRLGASAVLGGAGVFAFYLLTL